jgi:hypothetical protein
LPRPFRSWPRRSSSTLQVCFPIPDLAAKEKKKQNSRFSPFPLFCFCFPPPFDSY